MLNAVFITLILGAVLFGAWNGTMAAVSDASIESAKSAVTLALGLIGMMALWLGLMRVVRDAGGLAALARLLSPVMRRLFPDIPADHPAMGAMILNMASNMLGLGNAATPFGLKAMRELETLNDRKGVATDSMALFLAINTSGVAVLPLGVIAVRAQMDASNAGGIILPSLFATMTSTLVAIVVVKALQRRTWFRRERFAPDEDSEPLVQPLLDAAGLQDAESVSQIASEPARARAAFFGLFAVSLVGLMIYRGTSPGATTPTEHMHAFLSFWLLPLLMAGIVLYGFSRRVNVYDSLVKGAKEGFQIAVMIIPFLVAILVAVGMFRASGALDLLVAWVQPATTLVGIPAETLPMALIRPLSGSGAFAVMTETLAHYGPDSFIGWVVSVVNGSTETTFYVLAIYFGSVQIRATRHTLAACLCADATGFLSAVFWCHVFYT